MRQGRMVRMLAWAVSAALLLSGCGAGDGPSSAPAGSGSGGVQSGETSDRSLARYPDFFHGISVEGEMTTQFALSRDFTLSVACSTEITGTTRGDIFAVCAQKLSDWTAGRMTLQLYDGQLLNSDGELIEALKAGTLDLVMCDQSAVLAAVPELAVVSIPGLYDDLDGCNRALAEFTRLVQPYFEARGLHLLYLYADTFDLLTANQDLQTPEDLRALAVRMGNDPYIQQFWDALGCRTMPMSLSNTYLAMQQGEINAAQTFWNGVIDNRIYELQDYVLCSSYLPSFSVVLVSGEIWAQMTETEQQALTQMYYYKMRMEIEYYEQLGQSSQTVVEDNGVEVISQLSSELLPAFQAAAGAVADQLRGDVGEEWVSEYLALAEKF